MIWFARALFATFAAGLLQVWGIVFVCGACFIWDVCVAVKDFVVGMWKRRFT